MRVRDPVDYSRFVLGVLWVFTFVIGLSIEEPSFNRTAPQKALVAAKAWVSHYPNLGKIIHTKRFNDALERIKENGVYDDILDKYGLDLSP